MKDGIEIRRALPEDSTRIVELISASYGGANVTNSVDYWRWKHEANPFGRSPCLLAEHGGELVGVRAFLRWTWQTEKETVPAVRAVDTATHPEWQGRGIFSRLTKRLVEELTREGVGFVYNTPNAKSRPGYLKMGWRDVTRIPVMVRPLRPFRLISSRLRDAGGSLPAFGDLRSAADVVDTGSVRRALEAARDPSERRFHTPRSQDFLRWRYAAVPGFRYVAETSDAGAVFLRGKRRRGLREVAIADIVAGRGLGDVVRTAALVRDVLHRIDADYAVACAARDTNERRALAMCGFLPVPRIGPHFTARPLNPTAIDPCAWESWRLGVGDLELF